MRLGIAVGIVAVLFFRGSMNAEVSPNAEVSEAVALYRTGNYAAAAELFERLARSGDAVAQNWLASMYELGVGVPHRPNRALALYRMAAEGGNRWAKLNLAMKSWAGSNEQEPSRGGRAEGGLGTSAGAPQVQFVVSRLDLSSGPVEQRTTAIPHDWYSVGGSNKKIRKPTRAKRGNDQLRFAKN